MCRRKQVNTDQTNSSVWESSAPLHVKKNLFVGSHLLQHLEKWTDETGNHLGIFLPPLLAARAAAVLVERVPTTAAERQSSVCNFSLFFLFICPSCCHLSRKATLCFYFFPYHHQNHWSNFCICILFFLNTTYIFFSTFISFFSVLVSLVIPTW